MKHAYLIMAHDDFYLLSKLIQAIDNPDGDIFIHLDAGRKYSGIEHLKNYAKYSNIHIYSKIQVSWGGEHKSKLNYF